MLPDTILFSARCLNRYLIGSSVPLSSRFRSLSKPSDARRASRARLSSAPKAFHLRADPAPYLRHRQTHPYPTQSPPRAAWRPKNLANGGFVRNSAYAGVPLHAKGRPPSSLPGLESDEVAFTVSGRISASDAQLYIRHCSSTRNLEHAHAS